MDKNDHHTRWRAAHIGIISLIIIIGLCTIAPVTKAQWFLGAKKTEQTQAKDTNDTPAPYTAQAGKKAPSVTQKKSLWSRLWGRGKAQSNTYVSPKAQQTTRRMVRGKANYIQKSAIRYDGFAVYHAAKNIDPALLYMNGREPETAEELQLASAAHNTAKVAHALASRRKVRERMAQINQRDQRNKLRRDLAIARTKNKTSGKAAQQKTTTKRRLLPTRPKVYNNPAEKKPSRVFTDF